MLRAHTVKQEQIKYESGVKMEDYRLWLQCMQSDKFKVSNIGSTLVKLRKHSNNKSANHTVEDEASFKLEYLLTFIVDEVLREKLVK